MSNHSISRCLYRTRTHAQLFLIETLLPVNRLSVIFERNTVRVCVSVLLYVVPPENVSYSLMSGWHLVKMEKKKK